MGIIKKIKKLRSKIRFKIKLAKIKKIFKKKEKQAEFYTFKEVIVIILFSFGIGIFACFSAVKIFSKGSFSLDKNLNKFYDAFITLKENYYEEITDEKLIDNAIKGMLSSTGDTYTNYNDLEETEEFLETVEGTYEGIGATIGTKEDKTIYVADMFKDGPSDKAGLKKDDIILSVDNKKFDDVEKLANYVKKEAGKKVKVKVLREEKEKTITITRGTVELQSVESSIKEVNDKKIGYIDISVFSSVTDTQFAEHLKKLEKEKIEGLVIDVRSNGGGYLSVVTDIVKTLLPKDRTIYKLEMDGKVSTVKDNTKEKRTYPIAVLINGGSASASEILAASIKESYKGYLVGTKTFGKGTVQQTSTLSDGSMIKYTIEKWLTPAGNYITDVGIDPTNKVKMNEEYYQNYTEEFDNQLQEALQLVSK